MSKNYNLEQIYVGELYLYTDIVSYTPISHDSKKKERAEDFFKTGAIDFEKNPLNRYIDWENGREYTGFLTMFYKQGKKYICMHDGNAYEMKGQCFIENLVPLSELVPKLNAKLPKVIAISEALQLFDILFKKNFGEISLYDTTQHDAMDFYIGDIILRERKQALPDDKIEYINLPQHIMLAKSNLLISSFQETNYINRVYRCLFLQQDVDLYNVNSHEFYNPYENSFQSIANFKDYIDEYGLPSTQKTLSIPKALKLLRKTLE